MDRNKFLKQCLACAGGTLLVSSLQNCTVSNYYAKTTSDTKKITISKTEFIQETNGNTKNRQYVIVRHETIGYPLCVFHLGNHQYTALVMQCTHNSCELQPQGNYLVCPCHGSEFSNTGLVQNPPAEQNLKAYNTLTDEENIYILL